jgi:hypothetical protein
MRDSARFLTGYVLILILLDWYSSSDVWQLDYKQAVHAIVRKFTNYRNSRKRLMDDRTAEVEAMKEDTAALVDLKPVSKCRAHFAKANQEQIRARRIEILAVSPCSSLVAHLKHLYKNCGQKQIKPCGKKRRLEVPSISTSEFRCSCRYFGFIDLSTSKTRIPPETPGLSVFACRDRHGRVDAGV